PPSTLFPYTTLFRSALRSRPRRANGTKTAKGKSAACPHYLDFRSRAPDHSSDLGLLRWFQKNRASDYGPAGGDHASAEIREAARSEEHTSELQSPCN